MSRSNSFVLLLAFLAGTPSVLAADPPAAASSPLAEAYRALAMPSPGEPFDLPGGVLRVGRAELTPAPGIRARPLVAAGRICGLLIDGAVTLTYHVDDAFSVPVGRRNLKHASGLLARVEGKGFVFSLPLAGAAIWGADPALSAAQPEVPPGARLPPWLNQLLTDKIGGNPAEDLLASERNGEPGYRWAVFHAAGDDYVLDVDPRRALAVESFGRLERVDRDVHLYGGRLALEELVSQPIGRTWWDSRPLDLVSVSTEVEIVNDRAEHATIASKIRIQALRDGVQLVQFGLLHDFTDSDGRVRHLELESVKVDGTPAVFVQDETGLLVELPKALLSKGTAELEFRTQGDVLDRPEGNSYWILRTQAWYPKPIDVGGEFSTFKMTVESAAPFVPFASGEIVKREKTALGERVTTSVGVPAQWAVAIAGKYETYSRELDGLRVHVSTYAATRPAEAERISGIILGIRACMEHWLGVPYPFQDLEVVEVKDWGWGQAPPGVIFITQEAFMTPARAQGDDENSELAAWYSRGVNERIAHEVAHSWFPHVAKIYRSEENWLSESLAEYSSAVCLLRSMQDKKQAEYLFNRQLSDWKSGSKEIGEGGSIYLAPHISIEKESDALAVQNLWYAKGPLVLHALRQELARVEGEEKGEKDFMAWVRAYAQNFKFKMAETRHLVGILNQITGKDWQPWFEKYVYGTETPKVK